MATATTTWILQDRSNTTCGNSNGGTSQYTITDQGNDNIRYFNAPNNNLYLYATKINSISVQIVHTHNKTCSFYITPRIYFNKLDSNNNRGYATFEAEKWSFAGAIVKKVYTRNLTETEGISLAPYIRSGIYELYRSWTRANDGPNNSLYWRSESNTNNYVYFSTTYEYVNPIHYYHNNTWENCCAYYYDGTNWILCNPYYYNGSGFQNLG